MGHTTQRDPIGLAGGVNQYGYAGGDPVNFSDPFGLRACDPPRRPCGNLSSATSTEVIKALDSFAQTTNALLDRVEVFAKGNMTAFAAEATSTLGGRGSSKWSLEGSTTSVGGQVGVRALLQAPVENGVDVAVSLGLPLAPVSVEITGSVGEGRGSITAVAVTVGKGLGYTATGERPNVGGSVGVPGVNGCNGCP